MWLQLIFIALLLGAFGYMPSSFAQDSGSQPDNTKTNKRDLPPERQTAEEQKENGADRQTSRAIRLAVVKDKHLSMYAHNVKIITQNGHVTLKGPVRTEEEKANIEVKAVEVAGQGHVTNKLEVAAAK